MHYPHILGDEISAVCLNMTASASVSVVAASAVNNPEDIIPACMNGLYAGLAAIVWLN